MGKFCLVHLGKAWQLSPDSGAALVIALMVMFLLTALGTALVLNTSTEVAIAANFRISEEALYAADAAAERALADLQASTDWDSVLSGASPSTFIDGPPTGVRRLAGGTTIDLTGVTNIANCGHASACTSSEMSASTVERPWGSNNPVWRPYAYGPAER